MAIDLRKLNTKHNTQAISARIPKENVTIPYYWIVNGNVITNLRDAREYKNSK